MNGAAEQNPNRLEVPDIPARPFNPHRRCASRAMKEVVQEVLQQLGGYEYYYDTRKRKRSAAAQASHEAMVEAVVCDLVYRELEVPGGLVHVTQSNQTLRKSSRYKGVALGKTLPDVLKVMAAEEMGFVVITPGQSKFAIKDEALTFSVSGTQTCLAAGRKLLSRIETFGLSFTDIGRSEGEETIVLRGPKPRDDRPGELIEYNDTEETTALRQQMQTINAWLDQAEIECSDPAINLHDRHLKRIFNNADFAQGGRLFGGFWQRMSHAHRLEGLLLDDDSAVELDYGQMGLLLLYGLEDAKPPAGDLYDLSEYGIPTSCRPGIKKVVQAAINASKPLGRMPKNARKTIPQGVSLKDVLAAVEQRHPDIVHRFGAGIGMQLMRLESDILVGVLLDLKDRNITALPIHDAVLVSGNHEAEAKDVMIRVFQEKVGLTPEVSVEHP
nr:hypothetical protein [uncultured Shimia sp.]